MKDLFDMEEPDEVEVEIYMADTSPVFFKELKNHIEDFGFLTETEFEPRDQGYYILTVYGRINGFNTRFWTELPFQKTDFRPELDSFYMAMSELLASAEIYGHA